MKLVYNDMEWVCIRTGEDKFSQYSIKDAEQILAELKDAIAKAKEWLREDATKRLEAAKRDLERSGK